MTGIQRRGRACGGSLPVTTAVALTSAEYAMVLMSVVIILMSAGVMEVRRVFLPLKFVTA